MRKKDVLVGISTSGKSRNICLSLKAARGLGAFTIGFTDKGLGAMADIADAVLQIPSDDTVQIQEGDILCGHMLCDWVELSVCESRKGNEGTVAR